MANTVTRNQEDLEFDSRCFDYFFLLRCKACFALPCWRTACALPVHVLRDGLRRFGMIVEPTPMFAVNWLAQPGCTGQHVLLGRFSCSLSTHICSFRISGASVARCNSYLYEGYADHAQMGSANGLGRELCSPLRVRVKLTRVRRKRRGTVAELAGYVGHTTMAAGA